MSTQLTKKECKRCYDIKYRARKRARRKATNAAWYLRNKTAADTRNNAWNAAHREDNRSKSAATYRKNKERLKPVRKLWIANNLARHKANRARWNARNKKEVRRQQAIRDARRDPAKVRVRNTARRAIEGKTTAAQRKLITAWERAWKAKSRVTCYWCQKPFPPSRCHSDHIIPLKPPPGCQRGRHEVENLCVACVDCNQRKHNKPIDKWNALLPEPVLL